MNPTDEEIRGTYMEGRMKLVCQRFGISLTQASRLCKRAGVKTSKKTVVYREDVFDVIDSEHKAYVLGLLVSDGYIVEGPKRYIVSLGSTDRYIPEAFASLVEYGRPVYEVQPDRKKRLQVEYRIMLGSKRLVTRLVELGIRQRKSLKETPVAMPKEFERHFARGLIDGDGSIGIYDNSGTFQARMSLVGSRTICTYFAEMIRGRGLSNAKPRKKSANGLWSIQYAGNESVAAIGRFLYGNAVWKLPRKADVLGSIPMVRHRWTNAKKPSCDGQGMLF